MKKVFSVFFCFVIVTSMVIFVACNRKNSKESSGGNNALISQEFKREGDYIYFGEYAQSIKAENVTVTEIEGSKFFMGSDGEKYVKVKFEEPNFTPGFKNSLSVLSNGENLQVGNDYYFKVEPLRWRILNETSSSALIVCEQIIDQIAYQPYFRASGSSSFIDKSGITDDAYLSFLSSMPNETYASNYKYSYIRFYLNNIFLSEVFSQTQQSLISQTFVDNSAQSSLFENETFACQNTWDYIFLLSAKELNKSTLGFKSESELETCPSRAFQTTDYAKAKGLYTFSNNNGCYFTRSACGYSEVYTVYGGGELDSGYSFMKDCGLVPALNLKLR